MLLDRTVDEASEDVSVRVCTLHGDLICILLVPLSLSSDLAHGILGACDPKARYRLMPHSPTALNQPPACLFSEAHSPVAFAHDQPLPYVGFVGI